MKLYLPFNSVILPQFDSICSNWRENYKKHHLNKYMLESFTYGGVIEKTLEKLTKDLGLPPKSLTLSKH